MTPARARLLLGVGAAASGVQVEEAFRRKVWSAHPDRGGNGAEFADLAEARAVLLRSARARIAAAPVPRSPVLVVRDASLLRQLVAGSVQRWVARRWLGHRRVS